MGLKNFKLLPRAPNCTLTLQYLRWKCFTKHPIKTVGVSVAHIAAGSVRLFKKTWGLPVRQARQTGRERSVMFLGQLLFFPHSISNSKYDPPSPSIFCCTQLHLRVISTFSHSSRQCNTKLMFEETLNEGVKCETWLNSNNQCYSVY